MWYGKPWLFGVIILALLLAACGGGEDAPPQLVAPVALPTQDPAESGSDQLDLAAPVTPITYTRQALGPGTLYDVRWSPDGAWLALNGSLGIWRLERDALEAEPVLSLPGATLLAFSADGTRAAIRWMDSGALALWDVGADAPGPVLNAPGEQPGRVALSQDGARLAVVVVPEVDATSGAAVITVGLSGQDVLPEGSVLRVIDVAADAVVVEYPIPEQRVLALSYAPDGMLWLAGSANNVPIIETSNAIYTPDKVTYPSRDFQVRVWVFAPDAPAPAAPAAVLAGLEGPAADLALSADGARAAGVNWIYRAGTYSTATDSVAYVWDTAAGYQPFVPRPDTENPVHMLTMSADGSRLAVVAEENLSTSDSYLRNTATTVQVWEIGGAAPLSASASQAAVTLASDDLRNSGGWLLRGLAFSQDGAQVAAYAPDGLWVWDVASGALVATNAHFVSTILSAIFSADGASLITGETSSTIRRWDAASGALASMLRTYGGGVGFLDLMPDGSVLFADMYRGRALRADLATGVIMLAPDLGNASRRFSASSPDGTLWAQSSGGGTITISNLELGARAGVILAGHQVVALAFTADGAGLFSGGADGTILYWDLADRTQPAATLSGHTGAITDLRLQDDHTLLSASLYPVLLEGGFEPDSDTFLPDGTLRRWDIRTLADGGSVSVEVADVALPPLSQVALDALAQGLHPAMLGALLSPDGSSYAVVRAGDEPVIAIHDSASGTERARLEGHTQPVRMVTWSLDGQALVSVSVGGELFVWRAAEPIPVTRDEAGTDAAHFYAAR